MVKDAELLAQLLYPKWKEICRKCGISDEEIIRIEQSSGQNIAPCISCLKKGLAMWCEKEGNSTLFVLIEVLRKVECDGTRERKLLQNWFMLSSVVEMQRQRKGKCMDHL